MSVVSARSIPERIAAEIESRVAVLLGGSKPNTPLVAVLRPKRIEDFTPEHMLAVLTADDPIENTDLSYAGNPPGVAYDQRHNIAVYLMPSERDPTPIDTYINTAAADVAESLTDSGAGWHTMGGLAIDSKIEPMEQIAASGGIDGLVVPVTVTFRVSERSWYANR